MLWIILGAIIGIVIGIYLTSDAWMELWERVIMTFLLALLCSTLGVLFAMFSGVFADICADKTYHVVEDIEIYALQDNITTEGSFFLGSGHVDDELKYFYVEETELGYVVNNVDADNAYIKYTTDRYHLERLSYTFDNWFVRLIAFPMNNRYVFYIPDGSIINNYTVDLK